MADGLTTENPGTEEKEAPFSPTPGLTANRVSAHETQGQHKNKAIHIFLYKNILIFARILLDCPTMTEAALQTIVGSNDCRDALTALLKAAADQLRLSVLRILRRDTFSVQELCQILDVSQPGMSHHLKILATAGLVTTRREGSTIFYRRAHKAALPALAELQSAILASANLIALDQQAEQQLALINQARAENSKVFFEEHAGEFRSQQEQIVAYSLYGASSAELLASTQHEGALAIEIGPGEGEFLPELASRYTRVIAVDNASSMLEKSRQAAASKGLGNVEFLLADTHHAEIADNSADCVVINMVLHHVPSPADILADAAQWLRPGGVLSVTDLCPHDQSWARDACGDLWLGLNPDDLSDWAAEVGLKEGPSVYLAQKNGFRVQVRQFLKPART